MRGFLAAGFCSDMYDLHQLGWNSFQQLCLTITREILGQTVEAYLNSHDGGRDGAFTGKWSATGSEDLDGPFVIQCKFTNRPGYVLKPSDISDELEKAGKLVEQGLCKSYVLMTNAGLTGTGSAEVRRLLKNVGVERVRTLGSTWIIDQIRENKRLRMLVPRLYGLGDLSQILDERAYAQSRTILESMKEDLSKVVVTDAYRRAANAIDEHGFVLLVGEPASGKTTIASLLAMAALDQWAAPMLKLDGPGRVIDHWNPDEPSQFFWLDDAFGVTQYEESQVRRWNHVLPQIHAMLRNGAKIVMTSRDYIYNRARRDLKESAFPLLNESRVVIDVHDLSTEEKEQILYNHIKLGTQPHSFRVKIKPHLQDVASHERFIPETARRLGDPFFTRELPIDKYHVNQFVEKREQLLQEVLANLDLDSMAALALIYMRNGRLDSPIEPLPSETLALERLGSTIGSCLIALEALQGSIVLHSQANDVSFWQFRHPTVGDACAATLAQRPELIGIFIQGTEPKRLVRLVTCGDVGFENAVVVPKALFPLMVTKLEKLPTKSDSFLDSWAGWDLLGFLTYRCSKGFLSFYLKHDSGLLGRISEPGLFLSAYEEDVRLAKRLHELSLLPEKHRIRFVETVSDYALSVGDPGALTNDAVRSMYTDSEFEKLVQRLRIELVPRLGDMRMDWESNLPSGEPPKDYMQPFVEFLDALKVQFADDQCAVEDIDRELWQLEEWIEEHSLEEEEVEESSRLLEISNLPENPQSTRSIFDDIDADE